MEPFEREDSWTRVSYRRGRLQHDRRRRQPQHAESSRDRHQQPARRSYASVTRDDRRYREHYPVRASRDQTRRHRDNVYPARSDSGQARRYGRRYPPARAGAGQDRRYHGYRHRSSSFPPLRSQQRRPGGDVTGDHPRRRFQHGRFSPSRSRRQFNRGYGGQDARYTYGQQQRQPDRRNTDSENQNWVQSDDPDFTEKVRIIYRIIKSNHHLKNVSGKEPPPTIRKTTANLAGFIKPASPTDITQTLLEGNAKNWEHNAILILKQHYEENMSGEILDLAEFPTQEWEGPFQVASAWAHRNLGRRLKAETLHDAKAFLKANLTKHPPSATADEQGPAAAKTAPPAATAAAGAAAVDPAPPVTTGRPVTVQAMVHTHTTTATMTDQRGGDWSPFMADQEEEHLSPPLSPVPYSPPPPRSPRSPHPPIPLFPLFTPRESQARTPEREPQPQAGDDAQEAVTAATGTAPPPGPPHNPCVRQDDTGIEAEGASEDTGLHSSSNRPESLILRPTPTDAKVSSRAPGSSTPQPPCREDQGVTAAPRVITDEQPPEEDEDLLHLTDSQLTSHTPTRRPTRHVSTTRKMQDWGLCVRNRCLIIGDSNLARFPPFRIQDVQVDSYPGATFLHAEAILKKAVCTVQVDTVILSFGLNNRKQKTRSTTIKQLQGAVRTARNRFPGATILVPVINFSPHLPIKDRDNLKILNNHIVRNFDYVPGLSKEVFETENDNVHWTRPTAAKIFEHWKKQLN